MIGLISIPAIIILAIFLYYAFTGKLVDTERGEFIQTSAVHDPEGFAKREAERHAMNEAAPERVQEGAPRALRQEFRNEIIKLGLEDSEKALAKLHRAIEDSPASSEANEAARLLSEILPLLNLRTELDAGIIDAKFTGIGITRVDATFTYKGDRDIVLVDIPPGLYLKASSLATQNMITTRPSNIFIKKGVPSEVKIWVACANKWLKIPDQNISFTIESVEKRPKLIPLAAYLDSKRPELSYGEAQAAVWIVTDNSSLGELQSLRSVNASLSAVAAINGGGTRMIEDVDAFRGLKLVAEAGYDPLSFKIAKDMSMVISGLSHDAELYTWMNDLASEQREREMVAIQKRMDEMKDRLTWTKDTSDPAKPVPILGRAERERPLIALRSWTMRESQKPFIATLKTLRVVGGIYHGEFVSETGATAIVPIGRLTEPDVEAVRQLTLSIPLPSD